MIILECQGKHCDSFGNPTQCYSGDYLDGAICKGKAI